MVLFLVKWRRNRDSKRGYVNQSTEGSAQLRRYSVGGSPDRIGREMGVLRGRLNLGMAEKLADHWQPLAGGNSGRGERWMRSRAVSETPRKMGLLGCSLVR